MSRAHPDPRATVAAHLVERSQALEPGAFADVLAPYLSALPGPHLTEILARHGSGFSDDSLALLFSSPVALVLAFKNPAITPEDRSALTRGVLGLALVDPVAEPLLPDITELPDATNWGDSVPPKAPVIGPGSLEAQLLYRAIGLVHAGLQEPNSTEGTAEVHEHPRWWLPAVYALLALDDLPEHMLTTLSDYVRYDERATAAVIRHPMAGPAIWTAALVPWSSGDFSGRSARALIANPKALEHPVVRSTLIAAGWLHDHGLLRTLGPVLTDDEWVAAMDALARRDVVAAAQVIEQLSDAEIARLPGTVLQPLLSSGNPDVHMVGLKAVSACQGGPTQAGDGEMDGGTEAVGDDAAVEEMDAKGRKRRARQKDVPDEAALLTESPDAALPAAMDFEHDPLEDGANDEMDSDDDATPVSFDGDDAEHPPLPL